MFATTEDEHTISDRTKCAYIDALTLAPYFELRIPVGEAPNGNPRIVRYQWRNESAALRYRQLSGSVIHDVGPVRFMVTSSNGIPTSP